MNALTPNEAVTRAIINQVLTTLPDLSSNGFHFYDRGTPHPATGKEFEEMRSDLLKDFRIEEIQTACDYLQLFPIERGSYGLKHDIERWGYKVGKAGYVCNGATIVAAILCGYSIVREPNSPNCKFSKAS